VLIGLGLLLLYSSLRSNWAPWQVIWRYWPVLLIAWGLGKLWDYLRGRESAGTASPARFSGGEVGILIALIVLLGLAFTRKSSPPPAHGDYHFMRTVDLQGAKSVRADVVLGAGELDLSGGANHLFTADCYYSRPSQKPIVRYRVTGADGSLDIHQPRETDHIHFGDDHNRNDWTLRFGNQVPLDLAIKMGAGTGRLRLSGLQLTHLRIEAGVGTLDVNLGGDWKQSFDGRIAGGVGTVTLQLPTNVGVRVHATGGLGSVSAPGFQREGNVYVNSAYGKSPVTLSLDINGGIGTIRLEPAN
jgi:hypothetical protein